MKTINILHEHIPDSYVSETTIIIHAKEKDYSTVYDIVSALLDVSAGGAYEHPHLKNISFKDSRG